MCQALSCKDHLGERFQTIDGKSLFLCFMHAALSPKVMKKNSAPVTVKEYEEMDELELQNET